MDWTCSETLPPLVVSPYLLLTRQYRFGRLAVFCNFFCWTDIFLGNPWTTTEQRHLEFWMRLKESPFYSSCFQTFLG